MCSSVLPSLQNDSVHRHWVQQQRTATAASKAALESARPVGSPSPRWDRALMVGLSGCCCCCCCCCCNPPSLFGRRFDRDGASSRLNSLADEGELRRRGQPARRLPARRRRRGGGRAAAGPRRWPPACAPAAATRGWRRTRGGRALAVDETVILLHPPLPLAGVSIGINRGCHDSIVHG